ADEIAAALERALAVDPAERYPSAADLVDALAPALRTVRRTPATRRKGAPVVAAPTLPLGTEGPDVSDQGPVRGQGPVARGQEPEARDQRPAAPPPVAEPPAPEPTPAEPAVSPAPRFLAPTPTSAPEPHAAAAP